jgi:integrase
VVDPVNIERVRRFLELAGKMRDWMIMGLMTYLGLRPNEVVVLFWRELIDEHGRARAFIEIERGSSDRVEGKTKTGSYRLVKVFEPVRRDIERYYEWCGSPAGDERVFLNAKGKLMNGERLSELFGRHARKASVPPFRAYDQRHTCASLLFGGGDESNPGKKWSIAEVASHLGHSIEVCARRYLHIIKNPLYRDMPIELVFEHARAKALEENPGTTD